jgi:hypothetical protein
MKPRSKNKQPSVEEPAKYSNRHAYTGKVQSIALKRKEKSNAKPVLRGGNIL